MFSSRNVMFREKIFPFQLIPTHPLIVKHVPTSHVVLHDDDDGSQLDIELPATAPTENTVTELVSKLLGRGHKVKKPSICLQGFVDHTIRLSSPSLVAPSSTHKISQV